MKNLTASGLRGKGNVIYNPHFWIIIIIILALLFMYYSHIYFISLFDPRWQWLWRLVLAEFNNDINGSLFCIPFIYAALVFWWRGILITWFFSTALMLPRIRYLTSDTTSFVTNIILLLIPLLVVIILTLLKKWREAEKKAMAEREEERQAYIAQIITAQEDERKRISREIHDDTTQRLWIVANHIQNLATDRSHSIDSQTATQLNTIKDTILRISDDTRRLSIDLRPGILDDLGLVPAIRWLIDQLNSKDSIEAKILVEGSQRRLDHNINTHLFRIVQEALSNVRRHSEATQVVITLAFEPETVKMTVKDNGKGFSFRDIDKLVKQDRLGIISIQERVRLLNGILKIDSKRGKGTAISVEFRD